MPATREEVSVDYAAIREVNCQAFGGDAEARLVDQLRSDGLAVASLVAVEKTRIVGHILFSDLHIETARGVLPAASLAPMAVAPAFQRRGIGAALLRRGLELCRQRGKAVVVVVGHPEYYPGFGFSAELAKRLQSPYSGDVWMALELTPGALQDVAGTVHYPKAFDAFS